MIRFTDLCEQQKPEVQRLRSVLDAFLEEADDRLRHAEGLLLTGSVARGDARIGPYGILIDLLLVEGETGPIELSEVFGEDSEPHIPFHCLQLVDKIGLAVSKSTVEGLYRIEEMSESQRFAMNESEILLDPNGSLARWKTTALRITDRDKYERAKQRYSRFRYLIGKYRYEKWADREAWVQLAQNANEAAECYCEFLCCINGTYIPRKDWLAYITYNLPIKPDDHESLMEAIYTSGLDEEALKTKYLRYRELGSWMSGHIKSMSDSTDG